MLRTGTTDTVVVDSTSLRGSLQMEVNSTTNNIDVLFIKKDGTRAVPASGYSLTWTIADPTIVGIQSNSAWQFKATGLKAGSTTVIFKLMSGSTAVYTSPAITVTVSGVGFKMGDSLTYSFHDLDENNQPVSTSEQRKTWTVLRTGMSYEGRDVTIFELATDPTGAIFLSRDTVYIQMAADGSVYQYDMLRSLLGRVSGGSDLGDQLPAQWVKISNTSQTSAATWLSLGVDSVQVNNVTFPGVPLPLNVGFRLDAHHTGQVPATVPAGTYPNAVHTNQVLRLNVVPASIPLSALFDSLIVRSDH